MRQTSQVSLQSTLSNEEVSDFFSSSDDKYEIIERSRELREDTAKSGDDLNANDIRLDLRGAANPAFSSDHEELDLRLETAPRSGSLESSPEHQAELIRVPDSFKLSKYVINKEQGSLNNRNYHNIPNSGNLETTEEHDQVPGLMTSDEVVDLIDKLLLTNPGQSSTDLDYSAKFSIASSRSTSQEQSDPQTPQERPKMDTFNLTGCDQTNTLNSTDREYNRSRLTRMTHVYELPEEMDITLRNEVLLETGHKAESLNKDNNSGSSGNWSSDSRNVILSNGLPNGSSITSDYSTGEDEDELWTVSKLSF